jgi:hypothetical protein
MYSLDMDNTGTRREAGASNVIPFRHPNGWVVKAQPEPWPGPEPELVLDAAELARQPPWIRQLLSVFLKARPVSLYHFNRQKLRLPYGWRRLKNGTEVLFNRTDDPLFVWHPNTKKPERCGLRPVGDPVQEGLFYSDGTDGSIHTLGTSELHHALETLLDAWERGDRATADVLRKWLLGKHRLFLDITRAYHEKLEQRRAEQALVDDIMNNPAKPA